MAKTDSKPNTETEPNYFGPFLASYSPENVKKLSSTYEMLKGYSEQGLSYKNKVNYIKDVKDIKGLYNEQVDNDENQLALDGSTRALKKDITSYLSNNFNSALSQVTEEDLLKIGMKYLPGFETSNEAFEKLRASVFAYNSKLEQLAQNPDQYLAELIKGKDALFVKAVRESPKEYLAKHRARFVGAINNKISHYGLSNFVKDTRDAYKVSEEALKSAAEAKTQREKALFEKYDDQVKASEKGYWDSKIQDEYQKALDEDQTLLNDKEVLGKYTIYSSLMPSELISPIAKKADDEAKAKAAAEAKKK